VSTVADKIGQGKSILDLYAEAQRYFMGEGNVNVALARIAAELEARRIGYVVIGARALLAHGYRRFTDNIDLVLAPEGLRKFHRELLGLGGYGFGGYTRLPDSPNDDSPRILLALPEGVTIKLMTTGEYPGDGKPKPVRMPEPSTAAVEIGGINFVTLEKLIELKLASGMTAPDRLKDLADVQELIKIKKLGPDFARHLNPYVRDEFVRLSESVSNSQNQSQN
jgi:hypothetical protein